VAGVCWPCDASCDSFCGVAVLGFGVGLWNRDGGLDGRAVQAEGVAAWECF
jgi:hypothetical protein